MTEPRIAESIVCFSINEWSDVPRNQVQLMKVAAQRGYRVVYVETIGLRRPALSARDLRKILGRLRSWTKPLRQVAPRFWVYSPIALPVHGNRIIDRLNSSALRLQIKVVQSILGVKRPIVWSYLPQPLTFVRSLRPRAVVYFRVDEYSAFSGIDRHGLKRLEAAAVEVADLCVATSPRYLDEALSAARNKLWVPNGVDVAHYARRGTDPYRPHESPVLFMMGTLEYWLATELLVGISRLRRTWQILLAGPVRIDLASALAEPNIRHLGVIPYDDLPCYVGWADVCLVPFRVLPVTQGASAAKVFQYLAAGRPVVATPYLEHDELRDLVYIAEEDPEFFVRSVERALAEDTPERQSARRLAMVRHAWSERFARVESALAAVE